MKYAFIKQNNLMIKQIHVGEYEVDSLKNRELYDMKIRKIGEYLINEYSINSRIYAGCNGPYNDSETIVRNLCHLIVITSIECLLSDNSDLHLEIQKMTEQLISLREEEGSYILREKENKDKCNGVIGHAWIMEALIYSYKILNNKKYLEVAVELYQLHKFDAKLCLWNRPSYEKYESIDYTFNHQLWFAAISAELYFFTKDTKIKHNLDLFLNKLSKHLIIDKNGLICHPILYRESIYLTIRGYIKRKIDIVNRLLARPSSSYKENGYHVFNLVAFARLYKIFSEHYFWKSTKFQKALRYASSKTLLRNLTESNIRLDKTMRVDLSSTHLKNINIYGYPYNVTGLELYYLKQVFGKLIDESILEEHLVQQFDTVYNTIPEKNGDAWFDKNTVMYRIYEYYKAMEERDILSKE